MIFKTDEIIMLEEFLKKLFEKIVIWKIWLINVTLSTQETWHSNDYVNVFRLKDMVYI